MEIAPSRPMQMGACEYHPLTTVKCLSVKEAMEIVSYLEFCKPFPYYIAVQAIEERGIFYAVIDTAWNVPDCAWWFWSSEEHEAFEFQYLVKTSNVLVGERFPLNDYQKSLFLWNADPDKYVHPDDTFYGTIVRRYQ